MTAKPGSIRKGIACLVASAFGFALMAFFVRLADDFGGEISCFQKGFFRNAVAFAIALCVFLRAPQGTRAVPWRGTAGLLLLSRCVFGSVGIFANFYAISHIQVGEAMALNKTAPFFTVLLSALLLGERTTSRQILGLIVAFTGALLVVRPGLRADDLGAALLGLGGGLGAGLAYVCVHRLGQLGIRGTPIVLAFSGFSCLAAVPFVMADFRPMTAAQVLILLGAGGGAALGQFGVTAAYRYAEPREIAVFDYTGVIFSALFGLTFFGQIPDVLSTVGFALILFGALRLNGRTKRRR